MNAEDAAAMSLHGYSFFAKEHWCSSASTSYEISPRLKRKLDTMSQLALIGVQHFAPLLARWEPRRIGLCLANRVGGWEFGEPQMRQLHRTHAAGLTSPYLGSAWFPAAMQGEISLLLPCHGHSKTFVGDGRAFWHAFSYAQLLLTQRTLDAVIVGAVEVVTTPLITNALQTARTAAGLVLLSREASQSAPALARIETLRAHERCSALRAPRYLPFPVDAALAWLQPLHHALTTNTEYRSALPLADQQREVTCTISASHQGATCYQQSTCTTS